MKDVSFESADALNQAAITLLRNEFQAPFPAPFSVMLSGGTTPRPLFEALCTSPPTTADNLHIAYTDDRYVPAESLESNYGQSRPMLEALGLPDKRIMRVPTELPLDRAVEAYDAALRTFFAQGGVIRLALLGLGSDGHTCSLFSEADLERCGTAYAIAVQRPDGLHGISVTPALLNKVERILFLATGAEKADRIRQLRKAPQNLIAGKAVAGCKEIELWHS